MPTLSKIMAVARRELNFPGQKTFLRKVLADKLGYRFIKCKNSRPLLVQKPALRALRAAFLRRLKENDEAGTERKRLIYLSETRIRLGHIDGGSKSGSGVEWEIVHAAGDDGFVGGAELVYGCKSGDCEDFNAWLKEKLLPNLPPRCIMVLDVAPERSARTDRPPTLAARELAIRQWLSDHSVPFDDRMTKSELYHLVHVHKPPKKYVVEELLRARGHEALRLPPHLCDLNPVRYVWNSVKATVAEGASRGGDHDTLVRDTLAGISASDWRREASRASRLRRNYWHDDRVREDNESRIATTACDSSSASEDDEDYPPADEDYPARLGPEDVVQVLMSDSDDDSSS